MFRICTLASGSSGNAVYAEGEDGALLIDAGISGKRIRENLETAGGDIEKVEHLLITHDHIDHVRAAGILHRRHGIELWMTKGTFHKCSDKLGKIDRPTFFAAGATLNLAGFKIDTYTTPHDAEEPVMFVLERDKKRCGILTDLGHSFDKLKEVIEGLDMVLLESNYDPKMLRDGDYPPHVKRRISSAHGHLANADAGELILNHGSDRLKMVLLSHLSENNNCPNVALTTVKDIAAAKLADGVELMAAPRHGPSEMVSVSP